MCIVCGRGVPWQEFGAFAATRVGKSGVAPNFVLVSLKCAIIYFLDARARDSQTPVERDEFDVALV